MRVVESLVKTNAAAAFAVKVLREGGVPLPASRD
jgi:hypothetical protein